MLCGRGEKPYRIAFPTRQRQWIPSPAALHRNSMAAVSTDGSTVCVLIRRLNSSRGRSTPLVVRATPLARWHESEAAIYLFGS